jgi:predicted phosphoadenosine phosphosulfate sulfurtransferase
MAGRVYLGENVFAAALRRLDQSYREGHRVVVSNSGGKDSTICTELAIMVARDHGALPVDVVTRDEEIIFPGTTEYLERIAQRTDEIRFVWYIANQPIINAFDRLNPYWWVFDPACPELWVRQPPGWATYIKDLDIRHMVTAERFPPAPGREVHGVLGLRADESAGRMMGTHSAKGYFTGIDDTGVCGSRPIYDWTDGDVWKAIHDNGWDYNDAYDVMHRMGVPRRSLRIAPPTMNPGGAEILRVGAAAWPQWWSRVIDRLPSVKTFAMFGKRAIEPTHLLDESWRDTFLRSCIREAPEWIAERATRQMEITVGGHAHHATTPLPETRGCHHCGLLGSWRLLTNALYLGDPFSQKCSALPYVDPEYFRPGAGYWSGSKDIRLGMGWTRREPSGGASERPGGRREEGAAARTATG